MIHEITPVFVDTIDLEIEEGKLYISILYGVAVHLCACGCKGKAITPLGKNEWTLINNNGIVSLNPSIGNWSGERYQYHAHYFIANNKIIWC